MSRVYIERRQVSDAHISTLARDITHHLYARQIEGHALVVVPKPFIFMRLVRKHWLRLARLIQRERAQTLRADRILEFTQQLARMQQLRFVVERPEDDPDADVFFMREDDLGTWIPHCHTIYLAQPLKHRQHNHIESMLIEHGLLVLYENKDTHATKVGK